MELVGSAEDGDEALSLIERHQADILITDIMMPGLNGLELSKKAQESNPLLKIMIITGYDEFEFARSAIELKAYSYMLKPVNIRQLKDKLEMLGSQIVSDHKSASESILLKKQFEESKPFLVEKFMKDLIFGYLDNEDTICRRAEALSVAFPESGYRLLLIQIDNGAEPQHSEVDHQLLFVKFYHHLLETYSEHGMTLLSKENEFILILYDTCQDDNEMLRQIDEIRDSLHDLFHTTITISVSDKKNTFLELHEAYREAETASRQKFYLGKGNTICYQDFYPLMNHAVSLEDKIEQLLADVAIGRYEQIDEAIDRILKLLPIPVDARENTLRAFCFRMLSDMHKMIYNLNEKVETIYGEDERLWEPIYRFDTIPDAREWLISTLTALSKYIHHKRSRKHSLVVQSMIDVLEQRYDEQITIDELAKKVFLTPSYICNIFKENVGESIIDYLIKVRIKHAKALLTESDAKIYEIAEQTGFNSTSYFSSVFKSMCGVSPKAFREAGRSGREQADE